MAHHLARLFYRMLRYGEKCFEKGIEHYEHKFRLQRERDLMLFGLVDPLTPSKNCIAAAALPRRGLSSNHA